MNQKVLEQIRNGLIVSCQARKGWAMEGSDIMAAFAVAAEEGGAVGIRSNGPNDIRAIREKTQLPIIGINKVWDEKANVFITPTFAKAEEVILAGANIVALDGTDRNREVGEELKTIVKKIHDNYPDVVVMADIDNYESAKFSVEAGVDVLSTTLCGYTEATKDVKSFSFELLERLVDDFDVPIIPEGKIDGIETLQKIVKYNVWSVVIGTAITRPEVITKRFIEGVPEWKK